MKIELRTISISAEIATLPTDAEKLVKLLFNARQSRLESIYSSVLLYHRLEKKGSNYWTKFDCRSVGEFLVRYDLLSGTTLARWQILVELVTKETLLILGEDCLFYMQRAVGKNQPRLELMKKDFKNIFEIYCLHHKEFNKTQFYIMVDGYIKKNYGEKSFSARASNGNRSVTTLRAPDEEQSSPVLSNTFDVTEVSNLANNPTPPSDPHFVAPKYKSEIEIAVDYIKQLHGAIVDKSGLIPEIPKELKKYFV